VASVRAANDPEPVRTGATAISPRLDRHQKDSTNPFTAPAVCVTSTAERAPCPALSAARGWLVGDELARHMAPLSHLGQVLVKASSECSTRRCRLASPLSAKPSPVTGSNSSGNTARKT